MNHEVLIVLGRDPYIGLLQSIYIWGLYNPLYKLNDLGFGHCSLVFSKYDFFCLLQQNANVTSFFMCISSQVGFHPKTKQDIHEKFPSFLRGAFYFRNFPSWRCPSYGKNKTNHPFATRPCNLRNHPKRSSSPWLGIFTKPMGMASMELFFFFDRHEPWIRTWLNSWWDGGLTRGFAGVVLG